MAETQAKYKSGDTVNITGTDGKSIAVRITADPWLTGAGWMYKCREQNGRAHILLEIGIPPAAKPTAPAA